MKKFSSLLLAFLVLFSSCKSAVIFTHEQVMNRINTKQDLINKFGLPTNKSNDENLEQWLYDYGTVNRTSTYVTPVTTNATATYNSYLNNVNVNATTTGGNAFTSTSSYKKYAKFLLNGDSVVRWESVGVNEEVIDKKQRSKNIWYPTLIGVAALVTYLILDEAAFQRSLDQDDYDYWND
jgi:hypothetical protein